MKKFISLLISLPLFSTLVFAEGEERTYYYKSGDPHTLESWRLTPTESDEVPTEAIDSNTNLVFLDSWYYWMNYYNMTAQVTNKTGAPKSITIDNVRTITLNLNGNTYIDSAGDFTVDIRIEDASVIVSQSGVPSNTNGYRIAGDMSISSTHNFKMIMQTMQNYSINTGEQQPAGTALIQVGGTLSMNPATEDVLVRFQLSESNISAAWNDENKISVTLGDTNIALNLGGLNGNGTFSACNHFSSNATMTFQSNADGVFEGGEWTGMLTKYTGKSYTYTELAETDVSLLTAAEKKQLAANMLLAQEATSVFKMDIVMASGDANVAQKMNIKKSATEANVNKLNITVNSGRLEVNSELAVDEIVLDNIDENLNKSILKFESAEKVGKFTIAYPIFDVAATLIRTDSFKVGEFVIDIADPYDEIRTEVIFTAEDIASMGIGSELTILTYESLLLANVDNTDANSYFIAKDESGNDVLGSFRFTNLDGEGALVFASVPEAAEIASIAGLLALAFAAYRRRK